MPAYGKVKVDTITYDLSGTATDVSVANIATKASPTFTGTVTVPTPSANDNSTKAASTAYVQTELGDYLTTSTAASTYAPLASPTFTGSPTVPGYAALSGATFTGTVNGTSLVLSADLTVNGTTTTINTTTLQVEDKNIEIGKVSTPSDATADGGGLTLLGATNKTWNWVNATDSWTSSEHIHLPDNKKLFIGTSAQDLSIYHDSTNSYIDSNQGSLLIRGADGIIKIRANNNEESIVCNPNAAVEAYHNGVKKFSTDADGFQLTGQASCYLDLYSYESSTATLRGALHANNSNQVGLVDSQLHWLVKGIKDGAVELYHDNTKRLETTSSGINVTGAINVNGSELSAAPTITANADSSISANDAVVIQADGTVKKIEEITTAANYTYSSTVNLNTQDSESYTVCADPHNSNRWAVAYKDDDGAPNEGKIKIITRNGTSLTESSWHVFHPNTGGFITMCFDPAASGRIVIMYKNNNQSNNYYSRLVTFTGSAGSESFTNNSELETIGTSAVSFAIESGHTNVQPVGTSGNFLFVYADLNSGSGFIKGKMVNLSGTTLSTVDGNHASITSLHEGTAAMAGWGVNPSGTQGFISIRNQNSKWALKPITISGTGTSMTMTVPTLTDAGEVLITQSISGDNQHLSLAYVDDTHFVVTAKGGSNNSYSIKSFLIKYVGTTYTKSNEGTVPTTLTGTPGSENQSRMGILSNNLTTDPYKMALFTRWGGSGVTSGYNKKGFNNVGTVDLDNMTHSWSAQVRVDDCNSDVDMPYIAQQSGADQGVLLIYRHAVDDYMDGRLYLTGSIASNLSTSFIGFSSAAYTNGQSATINVVGNTTTKSSLTPGTDYYVTKTGGLATTASTPSVKAGIAISSTSLLIKGQ